MNRFIFFVFSLFVLSISTVFGQNTLEKDLDKTFRKYALVKLDNKAVLEKAKTGQLIKLQAYGRQFEFFLTPNDLRTDNYIAIETTGGGDYEMKSAEVITYKGKLRGDLDSEVRFTLTEEALEGFIYTGNDEKIFINQAQKFSKRAQRSDVIVYFENDLIQTIDLSDDIKGKMDFGLDVMSGVNIEGATSEADLRQIEVATEADYQWVSQAGGAAQANNEILGIMNNVDAIYRRDLNLTVKVTFQHAWSTPDPYVSGVLDAFLGYWNATYPRGQYPRDTAHLFTGKFSNQGLAYIGVICVNPTYSYGYTARSGSANHLITAHEIGHNLGADHVENSGACARSMMNPSISSSVTNFCQASINTITSYVTNYGSCLSVAGTSTPTPTPTPTITPTPTPPTPTPTPFPTITPTPNPTASPTPAGRTNVALTANGGVASASSSSAASYAPNLAINGGRSWGNGGGWRDGTADSYPDWLQVDFNGSKTINEIDVYAVRDDYSNPSDPSATETFSIYGITGFNVQYWNGSSWITVTGGNIVNNNKVVTKILFSAVTTNKIRVTVNAAQAGYSRIVEVEAWTGSGTPTPTPTVTPTPTATPTPNPTPTATPTPNPTPTVRTNVALAANGGAATASSVSSSSYAASLAINGNRNWSGGGGWRDGTPDSYPDWLQVDFNGSKTINEIDVYAVQDDYLSTIEPTGTETFSIYGITSFNVQYWNGSSWVTVPGGNIANNNKVVTKITFAPVTTTKIRVVVNAAQAGYSRIVEIEAWSGGGGATIESASGFYDNNTVSPGFSDRLAGWRNYFINLSDSLLIK